VFSKIGIGLCVLFIAGSFSEVMADETNQIKTSESSSSAEVVLCEETLDYVVGAADIDPWSIKVHEARFSTSTYKSMATLAFSVINNLGALERHDFTCSFEYGQLEKVLLGDMEVEVWP
jgi:hypothetical protein